MSVEPDRAELQSVLVAIEPAARLVPVRALRRAIRLSHKRDHFHPHAAHDRCWRVRRDQLFELLTPGELGLSPAEPAAELLLIPTPREEVTQQTWRQLWRTLFHAAVDRAFDDAVRFGRIEPQLLRDVPRTLGPAKWHALEALAKEENLIDGHDLPEQVVREIVALALEVEHFSPGQWNTYFPGISPDEETLVTIGSALDSARIYQATRPPRLSSGPVMSAAPASALSMLPTPVSDADRARVAKWADRGNHLRASILLHRAGDPAASDHLNRLLRRLQAVLELTREQVREWEHSLRLLLPRAAAGGWPLERRLLYDLQRACLAIERPTYAADLVEWIITFGRRPIKRPLPKTKWVEATRRFRAAWRYAERLVEAVPEARPLIELTEHAAHQTEHKARDDLRPELNAVLDEVGLVPQSVAERLSRDKLVGELLDVACDRGFLRIGDLRDAIARNRVKLSDLTGPGQLARGDPLILANQKLPERLDGVYRRGEIYMRLLQRGCSIFFGTPWGRAFTKYLALPVGGAYLLIEAVHHLVGAGEGLVHWLSGWSATIQGVAALGGGPAGTLAANPTLESSSVTWPSLLAVATLLFLLLHWPAFRGAVMRVAKFALVKLPRAIRRSRLIRAIVDNHLTRFFRYYLLFPLSAGTLAVLAMTALTSSGAAVGLVGAGVALLAGTFFRTPVGREAEDRLNETLARVWRIISVNFVVGLLTFILHVFRAVFEAIDRGIHAVDEWLRFGEGETRVTFVLKLLLGSVWFIFSYLFRFAWNLLVEPQINPIKHFPVVTVSHKLLLPLIPSLAKQFNVSAETMGTIVFGIPGIFGFLVWELKENWKLYRANAPKTIRPVVVGSHGEKVRALLRPGFHSGVVPKTFAKLRNAVRAGRSLRAAKQQHALEHIAEFVHRFADRDMAMYLRASRRWGGRPIAVGHVHLAPNQIFIPFESDGRAVVIVIEELGGWVIAGVAEPGWLRELDPGARAAFADALIGLYKRAGVHAVREQAAAVFGRPAYNFDAVPEGLIIPLPDGREQFFDYDDGPEMTAPAQGLPSDTMVFTRRPILWVDWVDRWEADAAGKPVPAPLIRGWHFLPPPPAS